DDQVLELLALMLYSRRLVAIGREEGGTPSLPKKKDVPAAPPFPFSERGPRKPLVAFSRAREMPDPSTFAADAFMSDQAAALVNPAADGRPFCAECTRAASRRSDS